MSKQIRVEVRVGYDEVMKGSELNWLGTLANNLESNIKRSIIDATVEKWLEEMPEMDIPKDEIRSLVKERIVDKLADRVIGGYDE